MPVKITFRGQSYLATDAFGPKCLLLQFLKTTVGMTLLDNPCQKCVYSLSYTCNNS